VENTGKLATQSISTCSWMFPTWTQSGHTLPQYNHHDLYIYI
jgi:hypothetical protein